MITLVLGGARSGKSKFAEDLARQCARPVTYVATLVVEGDADLAARVRAHRDRRPNDWTTVEGHEDLTTLLSATKGTVLIDSLGPWLAGQPEMTVNVATLCQAVKVRFDDTVIVSDEVGFGVHPETPIGRAFRDALGTLNQAVAEVADEVYLVVAGRALLLPTRRST